MNAMGDSIRNIERIQENDAEPGIPRSVTLALVVLGGACVVFAALAFTGRTSGLPEKKTDPLGDLLAKRSGRPATPANTAIADLSPKEVTFPQMLSDGEHPSTALAAVRPVASGQGATPTVPQPAAPATQPPPASDRLPVVPLPAQSVLEATPIVTRPRDTLMKAAGDMAKMEGASSPPGHEGAYQLQVSSFHTQGEAQGFADQLRARGHKAYVLEANVPGRGTWYRVRIGPFATPRAATEYRADFESKEHVVPFIVTPEMTKGH
jgi:DedD protein